MKRLRNLLKRFETVMTAETFAEAGEFETAREIMREEEPQYKRISKKADREYVSKIAVNTAARSK